MVGAKRHQMGHRPGRLRRPQGAGGARRPPEQGDAELPHHRSADARRRDDREGLRHRADRRLLRFRRRAARIRQRCRPLQGLQGDHEAPAGAVDVDLHARRRARHQGQRQRQDQEMGGSHRQEGLYRAAAVRHPPASRNRDGRSRRQARLHAGRPVQCRLAAQCRHHRRHHCVLHGRRRAGPVADGSLAVGRLGRTQSERGRSRHVEGKRFRQSKRRMPPSSARRTFTSRS